MIALTRGGPGAQAHALLAPHERWRARVTKPDCRQPSGAPWIGTGVVFAVTHVDGSAISYDVQMDGPGGVRLRAWPSEVEALGLSPAMLARTGQRPRLTVIRGDAP